MATPDTSSPAHEPGTAAAAERRPVRLPPPVRPGDRVGVAALSGPADPRRLEAGMKALAGLGFEPVAARNLSDRTHLFAGSDRDRLDAFHELAADRDLPAIVFLRGGYGLTRLLPDLDWELLGRRPRAYVGYSDLTPFLVEVPRRLGLASFHGPMVAGDLARGLGGDEARSLLACLAGELPRELPVILDPEERYRAPVEGPLLGGCLSLLVATLGTPWAPDLEGSVLFLEDVGEPLYRLDRMLTHLRLSGRLNSIRALIFGHLGCLDSPRPDPAGCITALRRGLADFPWPVAWGLPAGHESPNLTLPLGLPCRLEPAEGRLVVGEGPGS